MRDGGGRRAQSPQFDALCGGDRTTRYQWCAAVRGWRAGSYAFWTLRRLGPGSFFVSRRATGSGRWARLGVWWRRRFVGIGDAFELRTNPVDRPRDALEFFLDAL